MPAGGALRVVLSYGAFRKLWLTLALSSFGDWLGLLATTALAKGLAGGGLSQSAFAVSGVLVSRLLPAVLLGPLAGAFADRFDRRTQMVVCDVLRFALFASIPLVGTLGYLYLASFLIESVSLFWAPAKEATVPNLLPKERLETANQLSLITTYGSAPVAAAVFALLSSLSAVLGAGIGFFSTNPVTLALYFNALTFLVAAVTVFSIRSIPKTRPTGRRADSGPGMLRSITEGWAFVGGTPLVRGLVIGILGAFAAGGAIIALAPLYVELLSAGNAGYGVLFGAVFLGLAAGMVLGPRLLRDFSRRRLFGAAIVAAGVSLSVLALLPNLALALLMVLVVGAFAGIAWVTGYTLLGLEVADEIRGRTFSLVTSLVQVDLLLVLAVAPVIAGLIGQHQITFSNGSFFRLDGVTITMFVAGLVAAGVGVLAYRQMDDRPGVSLRADLVAAVRGERGYAGQRTTGAVFIAFEGGEGAGKSSQARLVAQWLRERGRKVVVTHEPGATEAGAAVRALLLDPTTGSLSPRAEALLYAADRAQHVARVIRPALDRGEVVLTDRYVDSSLAYQGAGRELESAEVARLSRWATGGLMPDLTVLLDLAPEVGLARAGRRGEGADRMESEALEFHHRVRERFIDLARRDPRRYAVIDATADTDTVAAAVRDAVGGVLTRLGNPLPAPAEPADTRTMELRQP